MAELRTHLMNTPRAKARGFKEIIGEAAIKAPLAGLQVLTPPKGPSAKVDISASMQILGLKLIFTAGGAAPCHCRY